MVASEDMYDKKTTKRILSQDFLIAVNCWLYMTPRSNWNTTILRTRTYSASAYFTSCFRARSFSGLEIELT